MDEMRKSMAQIGCTMPVPANLNIRARRKLQWFHPLSKNTPARPAGRATSRQKPALFGQHKHTVYASSILARRPHNYE
jgi:hypothetical protein